ncbi:hypothetical protein ACTHPH_06475 [Paenibacillus pasadenensis]|uniref:hypothetical protein n=1 Tax=Paenibacillus pasadenensis TaxID=217090 RepID=UPI00040CE7ED|nr:hypothetical protein [Paenibacillus pasadenensis]
MGRLRELLMMKNRLAEIMQMMDREASFNTEEGRAYCQLLVKVTLVQIEIDQLKKEKAAR